MTNEELIRQLKTASIQCDEMRLRDFGYLFKTAAEAIERLIAYNEFWEKSAITAKEIIDKELPKWISVKERLPKECTRVIGFMAWKAMTAIEYQNGKWYSIDHLSPLPDEAVTHWMPLPKPPKEVSECQ